MMGNPLIKREMELQALIKDLKMEKSRFNENLYELQDNIRVKYPTEISQNELIIKHYSEDYEKAMSAPKVTDDEGKEAYPMKLGNTVYNTRKEAGEALRSLLDKHLGTLMEGKEIEVGEYRGLKLSILYNDFKKMPQACLRGGKAHYCDLNIATDIGNISRLDNAILNIQKAVNDISAKNEIKKRDLEQMKIDVEKPFEKEQELRDLEAELQDVHVKLTEFELTDDTAQKDMFERLVDSFPEVMTGEKEYVKYVSDTAGAMPFHVEMCEDVLTLTQTYVQNGDLMYDPRIDFRVDYENKKVIPLTFENSGLGVYQEFDITDGKPETMKQINSILEFTDDWMDTFDSEDFVPQNNDVPVEHRDNNITI